MTMEKDKKMQDNKNRNASKNISNNTKTELPKGTSGQTEVKTNQLQCEVCVKAFHSVEHFRLHVDICKKVNLPCKNVAICETH